MSFKPTGEQVYAVGLLQDNRVIKLEAGAGCTKTTTLALMAQEYQVPSLYLAFNKALADEATTKFPKGWVTCKTTHSVAYAAFGRELQHKLKRPVGPYQNVCGTGSEIARYYKIRPEYFTDDNDNPLTAAGIGVAVKETVARFESSADEMLSAKHVSFKPAKRFLKDESFNRSAYEHTVVAYAAMLWKERTNIRSNILATHDTYLKLYQLSKPDLSMFEILYLDEMQDSSDCVIDIVKRQDKCKVVVVGDDAQAIYGWRGAVSAMGKFSGMVGQLTTSFRFGPAVASEARMVLSLKENGGMDLKGWDKKESHVYDILPERYDRLPRCQLYRTNAALIQDGVGYILAGRKVALEMDTRDYIAMMNSVVALRFNDMKNVKHEEVMPYASWPNLMDELEHIGGDIARIARLVAQNEQGRVLRALENYRKPNNPDLILTTAHKAKGREFEIVVLADDFPDVFDADGEWIGLEDAEANLLYVGLTRAMKILVRNNTLRAIRMKLGLKDIPAVVQVVEEPDIEAANDALALARNEYLDDEGDWRDSVPDDHFITSQYGTQPNAMSY